VGNAPTAPMVFKPCPTTECSSKPGRAFSIASTQWMPPFLIPNEPFCICVRRGLWALLKTLRVFKAIVGNAGCGVCNQLTTHL